MTHESHIISCSEAVRQLWEYVEQALSSEDSAKVERHLAFCRRCCGELEFAKELQGFLATHAAEQLPPEVKSRLERFVSDL